MENGAADVNVEERQSQLSAVDVDDGDFRCLDGVMKDSEENEVFEEAVEPPLQRVVPSDSDDISVLGLETEASSAAGPAAYEGEDGYPEGEKFAESVDVQASNMDSGNQADIVASDKYAESNKDLTNDLHIGKNGDATLGEVNGAVGTNENGGYAEELELASEGEIDESLESSENQEASVAEGKSELLGSDDVHVGSEAAKEAVVSEFSAVEAHNVALEQPKDGLPDSSVLGSDGRPIMNESGQELLNFISKTRDSGGVDSDVLNVPGSLDPIELVMNEVDANHSTESPEQIDLEGKVNDDLDVLKVPESVNSIELVMNEVDANNSTESPEQIDCEGKLNELDDLDVLKAPGSVNSIELVMNKVDANNSTESPEQIDREGKANEQDDIDVLKVPESVDSTELVKNEVDAINSTESPEQIDREGKANKLDNLNVLKVPGIVNSIELVKNKVDANNSTESPEQIDHDGKVNHLDDISVASVGLLKEQAKNKQTEEHPHKLDNGFATNRTPSVQTKNQSSPSHVTNGAKKDVDFDTSRPNSQQKVSEDAERKHVLLENPGDSITDSIDNRSSLQTAPSANSSLGNAGGSSLPSRPVGLGSSAPLLEPSGRTLQQSRGNGSVQQTTSQSSDELLNDYAEENDETREKLQMIRVKFLRLARRLGQTPHNVVVAQVLYRLGLAEQLRRNANRPGAFGFERASVMAEQLEAAGQEPLDFSCTIMVIGKTGVGKSATVNSIFDEVRLPTDAFQLGTKNVQEIVGTVQGIKVRVIDTPGLFTSSVDQRRNEKILHSVKRFIKKTPPDIVLYFDRLDMQSRDYGDVPLLRTVTDIFGASIWFNAIVVLTHAASAPPDGPNGSPLSYEMFVTQRSHVVQQAIRQAAGDVRLMNPVSLVENHSACRMNRAGQRVLPNGQVWKPQLLLLSFASKILAEANMLLKLQDSPPGKAFGLRPRIPPLPFLLSSLLQSRPQLKLPEDQADEDDGLDGDSDDTSDLDDVSEYDELPPFKPLTKAQLARLNKAQKKAYFEEIDYREKLLYKKQLKEEKQRRKQMKKMAEMTKDLPSDGNSENLEDENNGPASVPVPLPDFVLPNSFDSDYPCHRYRILDSSSQWLVRPVLDSHGWDHDIGYEGLNVERAFAIKNKIPVSVSGQLTKDKKDCTLQMEAASSIKHSEGKASSLGLDLQTVGKDVAYTIRGETRFKNFRLNNTSAGVSVTYLGDSVSTGVKIEDKLTIGRRVRILLSGGAMTGRGEVAYGGRLEATMRDRDYPIGRSLTTLALSVVDWHGELAIGCNVQSQLPLGRTENVVFHGNFSNKGTGQVGIRLNSSEHLQIALLALVPLLRNAKRMILGTQQPT